MKGEHMTVTDKSIILPLHYDQEMLLNEIKSLKAVIENVRSARNYYRNLLYKHNIDFRPWGWTR
jgi:hypothetical protein